MAHVLALPIRIAQGFLALLILILMAYVVDHWSAFWSPDSANFLLFCAVWTLLAVVYLVLSSHRFSDHPVGHKFGVLAVEVVTTIFWFAGWIAFATLLGDLPASQRWVVKRVGEAAVVLAAFEWYVS
jgi:occludin/MAL family lipid-associated protein